MSEMFVGVPNPRESKRRRKSERAKTEIKLLIPAKRTSFVIVRRELSLRDVKPDPSFHQNEVSMKI